MEVAVPLVVGGLAGFSVATACGAEPRVPQVPPAAGGANGKRSNKSQGKSEGR